MYAADNVIIEDNINEERDEDAAIKDFKAYGDVLIFDTTYRTNKYGLICAPFVGINNHWRTTMFGCAFITDEKADTFVWLLSIFKKSLCGIEPKSIFTNQDLAMSMGESSVYPNSRHRLCLWHLQKNFVSHFGTLKTNPEFKNILLAQDVSKTWIRKKKEWFDRLYGLRDKWCTTLSKDIFSAGILSSQRVEVTNRAISFKPNRTTKLLEFFHIFEATVKRWRSTEKSDNFRYTTEKPRTTTKILKHAAEVYTLNLYKDFKLEFDTSLGAYAREKTTSMQYVKFFDVSLDEDNKHTYQVIYYTLNHEFMCSCMCFTETGLLSFHILKIMQMYSIHAIPERYILKRWTKLAKSMIWDENESV
ncbi:protein FAR1-RELATED SEQUENCE 5-like [Chenopodium quinoa]|uniref:protein FAR1-RELATED SEQUENCE 5-like n=1 Tax=Chenopodium quinoa TaxID=63459 RepID=UPI000B79A2EB|nr:protein FAR1-RELATED SEQUENCE 5-like [Chenopodium quinoa]